MGQSLSAVSEFTQLTFVFWVPVAPPDIIHVISNKIKLNQLVVLAWCTFWCKTSLCMCLADKQRPMLLHRHSHMVQELALCIVAGQEFKIFVSKCGLANLVSHTSSGLL